MLAELRTKSQITIPKVVINKLGIKEGDKLEITERNGVIQIMPVVVYPKKYVEQLKVEIAEIKDELKKGTRSAYNNLDSLFEALEG